MKLRGRWAAALVTACACGPAGTSQQDSGTDGGSSADSGNGDGGGQSDGGGPDGGHAQSFDCAVLHGFAPNPCPAVTAQSGKAAFCFRPTWPGVTGVSVYGGFGQGTDWTQPFLTLTNDGSGTFTGTATVPNGSYNYLYQTTGGADGLVKSGAYNVDAENPNYALCPPGAHYYVDGGDRACSVMVVPQTPVPLFHLRGAITYDGVPAPCWGITYQGGYHAPPAKRHEDVANYAETAADGTFDLLVAAGPFGVEIRYPFTLSDAGYPSPFAAQAVGIAKHGVTVGTADLTLETVDVALHDYAAMSPTNGSATLPVTFQITRLPQAQRTAVVVVSTNIAGNDPGYLSPLGTATSVTWDGGLGGSGGQVVSGRQYWWGSWQEMDTPDSGRFWTLESLLFPITFN